VTLGPVSTTDDPGNGSVDMVPAPNITDGAGNHAVPTAATVGRLF
jgi:hypothetical protein